MAAATGAIGIWAGELRWGDKDEAVQAAGELDQLGYSALWIPDTGGDVFAAVERLLGATTKSTIATGILNVWKHSAEQTAAEHARLTAEHGDRFLVGLGISHAPIIDRHEPGRYGKPLATMSAYLDALDRSEPPLALADRVLAALGPKMLALAAARSAGVHPYNTTPEHTALVRDLVGADARVLTEQAVVLDADAGRARDRSRKFLSGYLGMPNYVNHWRRLGFTDDDLIDGGSDRLVDAIVAWGDLESVTARVRAHLQAGADHVCVQVLTDGFDSLRPAWRELAPALLA